jgi:hypothetical protein
MANAAEATERRDALVERLFANAIGAFDLFSVYLGDVLGFYRALADKGPLSSVGLADVAGVHERYAREWLEQQAASGLLEVDSGEDMRRFRLPAGHDEALLDVSSLNYIAPMARAVLASIRPVDKVLDAFRSGGGVPYADYGGDLHESQAAFTRPLFENLLGKEWLPSVAELHERLLADPPARVADVACGQGRSSIEIARAYPKVRVDGIDSDRASIERAPTDGYGGLRGRSIPASEGGAPAARCAALPPNHASHTTSEGLPHPCGRSSSLLAPVDTAVVVRELESATVRIAEIEAFREGRVLDRTADLAAKSTGAPVRHRSPPYQRRTRSHPGRRLARPPEKRRRREASARA